MKPQLKTVYVPVNDEWEEGSLGLLAVDGEFLKNLEEQQLITFTQEEYNQHIQEVIKDALQTAADNSDTCEKSVMRGHETVVDKDSITDTLEETFNKWKM